LWDCFTADSIFTNKVFFVEALADKSLQSYTKSLILAPGLSITNTVKSPPTQGGDLTEVGDINPTGGIKLTDAIIDITVKNGVFRRALT
jgi:hypothetical protein